MEPTDTRCYLLSQFSWCRTISQKKIEVHAWEIQHDLTTTTSVSHIESQPGRTLNESEKGQTGAVFLSKEQLILFDLSAEYMDHFKDWAGKPCSPPRCTHTVILNSCFLWLLSSLQLGWTHENLWTLGRGFRAPDYSLGNYKTMLIYLFYTSP